MRDEIQRLTDEVAFLTRSRDEWRDLQQRAMACLRVCEERECLRQHLTRERDGWKMRAEIAEAYVVKLEAQLAAGGAK